MTKEQVLWLLRGTFGHQNNKVWEYVAATEQALGGSNCWLQFQQDWIIHDMRLYLQRSEEDAAHAH